METTTSDGARNRWPFGYKSIVLTTRPRRSLRLNYKGSAWHVGVHLSTQPLPGSREPCRLSPDHAIQTGDRQNFPDCNVCLLSSGQNKTYPGPFPVFLVNSDIGEHLDYKNTKARFEQSSWHKSRLCITCIAVLPRTRYRLHLTCLKPEFKP